MLKCLNAKMRSGFTLLEVIVAIFLITVGITASLFLVTRTIGQMAISSSQLIATYLTQEGIEIVRNIRDTNWIEGAPSWDDGLLVGDWEAGYNDPNLISYIAPGRYLKLNGGFYSYDLGTDTKFKRKITIASGGPGILKVTVTTEWQEKGRTYTHTAQENLYNWK